MANHKNLAAELDNSATADNETNTEKFSSRRQFLRAAGGVTFLALTPVGRGLFAANASAATTAEIPNNSVNGALSRNAAANLASAKLPAIKLPLFTALPYLQPGASSRLVDGAESIIVAWQTEHLPADFEVTFGVKKLDRSAKIARTERWSGDEEDGEARFNYAASLDNLKLGRRYSYRVRGNGRTILEGFFTTRQPRGSSTRFVAFGDNSYGDISDRAIAHQTYLAHPDFVMNTGDNVYDSGLDNEYARFFFPVYNADVAGPRIGAPLLRSVPFYTILANHDVHDKDGQKHPIVDFSKNPDSLAYFTNMHLPQNGPTPSQPVPMTGDSDRLAQFRACAGSRFPQMANYSFDYGDAHFLCLDSNIYVDPSDAALQSWIENDLKSTDAIWKFVVYHHPAFNVGDDHYAEQHMRVLMPILEKYGVDFVLNGHEHNYQRPQPLRFRPTKLDGAHNLGSKARLIPGEFIVDRKFDGRSNTRADGVLHIVTGAGGKHLYDPAQNENPASWRHAEDGNVDYVARMISDRHSISVFDIDGKTLRLNQIDESGQLIDTIRVTKA